MKFFRKIRKSKVNKNTIFEMKDPNLNTTKIKTLTQQDSNTKSNNLSRSKIKPNTKTKIFTTTKYKSRSKNMKIKGLLSFPQVHLLGGFKRYHSQ